MPAKRPFAIFIRVLYVFATLQFIRYYIVSTRLYIKMPAYLTGHERLPFQERVLPIFLMYPIYHWTALLHYLANRGHDPETFDAATPASVGFYFVSLLGFSLAGFFVTRLYRAVTTTGSLSGLVYPLFIVVSLWTYVVHIDANYSYPYDMLSLGFFTAGLYFIYTRRFLPLLAIMAVGTLNRETTLFLVGIYVLDAASRNIHDPATRLRDRFSPSLIPWARVAALLAIWLAIKLTLAHIFVRNSNAENYVRIVENIYRLKPRLWPSLLNICGYLLPIVWILRRRIQPIRFANYLYIFPFWFAIMFYTGVILETRIYGELTPFVTVACILLLERHLLDIHSERFLDRETSTSHAFDHLPKPSRSTSVPQPPSLSLTNATPPFRSRAFRRKRIGRSASSIVRYPNSTVWSI
jgi:hypothetical protein